MSSVATKNTSHPISRKEKLLLILLLVFAALAFHTLVIGETTSDFVPDVVSAFFSVSGISPQFVYFLVIGLFLIRRKDIADAYHGEGEPWSAMLFLVPGICLFMWGHFVDALDNIHVSFILIGFGAARYLSGRQLTRSILPPVLILVLATPLPAVLINQIIFPLQLRDTIHSVWLLNTIGVPTLAVGDMISMAEHSTRFAESCTALGFITWLTIFALAYVYIFRITRWHAVLLVLSAPFIAYAVNILRAFTLVLNPAMEVLTIHTLQSIVFFMIGFSLLYVVDTVLMRFPGKNSRKDSDGGIIESNDADARQNICLANELGDWKFFAEPPVKYIFLRSVRYSSTLYYDYHRNNQPVGVFIGTDDRLRRHRSMLSDKNAYQDRVGLVQEYSIVDLGPDIGRAVSIVTDNGTQRLLTYHWYEGVESIVKEILYAWLALDQSPFRREEQAKVTRLATDVELTPDGRMLADKRLREFLREMNLSQAKNEVSG